VDKTIISLENVSLIKQEKQVLNNISMLISSGHKINIHGGNGVGKTSLLKIISGITSQYSGNIHIDNSISINDDLFYIGHKYGLKQELTVRENIEFILKFNDKINTLKNLTEELKYYEIDNTIDYKIKFLFAWSKKNC
jgi:heme exporter protein A